jgi:hypothetical protein
MQQFRVAGNAPVQVTEKAAVGVAEKSAIQTCLQMQRFRVTENAAV